MMQDYVAFNRFIDVYYRSFPPLYLSYWDSTLVVEAVDRAYP